MPILSRAVQKISLLKQLDSTILEITDIYSKQSHVQSQTDKVTLRPQILLLWLNNAAHLRKRELI